MTLSAAQLLKQLEPAVRPKASPTLRPATGGAIESQSFDDLLSLAAKGGVHSGKQVEVQCNADPPLTASQLERLATAADQAEAAGAKQALMMIDGRGFVLDVDSRSLTAELTSNTSQGVQQVDAAVFVPQDSKAAISGLKLPPTGVMPASIAQQFESLARKAG